jgi:hypothetical protein
MQAGRVGLYNLQQLLDDLDVDGTIVQGERRQRKFGEGCRSNV